MARASELAMSAAAAHQKRDAFRRFLHGEQKREGDEKILYDIMASLDTMVAYWDKRCERGR